MHMLIKILTYADTAENALKQARITADQLVGEYMPFDYWADFETDSLVVAGKATWGNVPAVLQVSTVRYPTEDERGQRMVEETMECTKAAIMGSLREIRYNLAKYSDEDIFKNVKGEGRVDMDGYRVFDGPDGLRNSCWMLSQCEGMSVWLYGPYGEGITDPGYLQNILDHRPGTSDEVETIESMNKPLWVVPFDVHF